MQARGMRKAAGDARILLAGLNLASTARRSISAAAILWIAVGAWARQRPIKAVQTEARMMHMAGEAVARKTERKKQLGAKLVDGSRPLAGEATERPEVKIVVSIPDRKLALVENGRVVKVYPVAVGAAGTPSIEGEFRIARRLENPAWYAPGKMIPPGPGNPLGPRWLGLGVRGFGIHGTNDPRSIGRRASHGCIRMRNADVNELFARVREGDVVELHGERDATVAEIFATPGEDAQAGASLVTVSAHGTDDSKIASAAGNGTLEK